MDNDATQGADANANNNTPSDDMDRVESMSSEEFLGAAAANPTEDVEVTGKEPVDSDKDEGDDLPEENDQDTTGRDEDKQNTPDEGMSESERNAYFAQRRIAARQDSKKFIEDLQTESQDLINDIDESKFEDMSPEQAEILKNAERMTREMQVKEAIREVERARESTANSFFEAESKIPAFNPEHADYVGEELHNEAMADWAAAYCRVEKDGNGNPQIVGVKPGAPSPFEYLQDKAGKYTSFAKRLSARAQANAARNSANTEVVPVQQKGNGADSIEELEDRVGDISLA